LILIFFSQYWVFETSQRVMKTLPSLAGYEYNEVSLLEALWKIAKILRNKPPNDVERGC